MGLCWVESCLGNATHQCSGCKTATYCNAACQKADWATHKPQCKKHRMVYDMNAKLAEREKNNPPPKPSKTHCTGCNVKFVKREYEVEGECPDCGYMACESCVCHNSKGSCFCNDSNFGHKYCSQEPRSYHRGRGGMYRGDYHPSKEEDYELNPDDFPQAFEKEKRPCNHCGKVVFCLLDEYRQETW